MDLIIRGGRGEGFSSPQMEIRKQLTLGAFDMKQTTLLNPWPSGNAFIKPKFKVLRKLEWSEIQG